MVGSYRPLTLTSCLDKLLEKAVADNLSSWAEANKKFNKQQNGFRKNRSTNDNFLNFLKQLNLVFTKATQLQVSFLMSRKPSTKFVIMGLSLT